MRRPLATLVLGVALANGVGQAASPEGLWQPLDSAGKPVGLIRIFEDYGAYFGRIESDSLVDRSKTCDRCTDERKGQPIVGLILIRNMHAQGDEYGGGDVLDPETGKVYGCRFRLIDGGQRMIMRGYLGISLLGRSQTWKRLPEPKPDSR